MAKKYYAVKNGREIGIFDNWADCNKQISGFSGAIYKSFKKYEDAEEYFKGQEHKQSQRWDCEKDIIDNLGEKEMIAYVDGSNLGDGSAFSWGIVTFSKDLGKFVFNGKSEDKRFIGYRNIAGELFAVVNAVKFAINSKIDKIIIYHDYSGIRHWALGEWKTKNDLSRFYQNFFKKIDEYIEYEFVKVEGHTNDKFNEEADRLAKDALGMKLTPLK
jgi:ribonuclease HI